MDAKQVHFRIPVRLTGRTGGWITSIKGGGGLASFFVQIQTAVSCRTLPYLREISRIRHDRSIQSEESCP